MMQMFKTKKILISALIITISIICVPLYIAAQKYNFKNYTVADGLGSSTINHIFQDSKGYIWFATQGGGISRFDGKNFTTYTTQQGLINDDVTYIAEDTAHNIWIATSSGVSEFNGSAFQNFNGLNGFTSGTVYGIAQSDNGNLLFACKDGGVVKHDGKKFSQVRAKHGENPSEAFCVYEDASGTIWAGTYEGIYRIRHDTCVNLVSPAAYRDQTFFSLCHGNNGQLWFGSSAGTLMQVKESGQCKPIKLPDAVADDFIGSIVEDKNSNLWLATDHGLLKYSNSSFRLFSEAQGMSVNAVQAVTSDYEGNIWSGTLNGGANLLASENLMHYTSKEGLTGKTVSCFAMYPTDSTILVGSSDGLFQLTGHTLVKVFPEPLNITSLEFDAQHHLWLTAQQGVYVLEKNKNQFVLLKHYKQIAGKQLVSPQKVVYDYEGNVWIATYGSGLFCITSDDEKSWNTTSGFPSDKLLTVHQGKKGNIWIGSSDKGLIKYNARLNDGVGQGTVFSTFPATQNNLIWSICEDDSGYIYLATNQPGVKVLSPDHRLLHTLRLTNESSNIHTVAYNHQQKKLYLASDKNLFSTQPGVSGPYFPSANVLLNSSADASAIVANAVMATDKGEIFCGTSNGFWIIGEEERTTQHHSPKMALTSVSLFYGRESLDKYISDKEENSLLLPYNKNHLTFSVQALTVRDVKYSYLLLGQDETWSAPTASNSITFSYINPGSTYTFSAKAILPDGSESILPVRYTFTVLSPWWKTGWFYSVALLLIATSLYFFIKARERVLRQQNIKLEATVKERTHEIEQQKQTIEKALGEKEVLLKEIHHRVKNNLQTISSMLMLQSSGLKDEQAKKAIAESQNRVRSIALVHQKLYQTDGLEKVELNGFIKDLTEQVKSVYRDQSKNINIHWDIPETHLVIDKAIPLGLIFNELLTNSFKYAFREGEKGEIRIELIKLSPVNTVNEKISEANKVSLRYWDSGPGLESSIKIEEASTLGLRLIKLLSQQIGATLNLKGSEFIFTFTINI